MFTGIIKHLGVLQSIALSGDAATISISSPFFSPSSQKVGDSVAINGVCLTVTNVRDGQAEFDLATETLRCSTLGELHVGAQLNLESSLKLGDSLDGHLVQGHVDAVGEVVSIAREDNTYRVELTLPQEIRALVAAKGSVTINGVSLTVGEAEESSFSVYVIPHTWQESNFKFLAVGERVNLEADCVARYVKRVLETNAART